MALLCSRLVLATGYFEHANLLGVPGEDLPHVSHWFDEPHLSAGQDVVIVGGKNSAVEAALLCFRAGARVTLVHRRTEFKPSVKYWLRPDIENRIKAGEIRALFGAVVVTITRRACGGADRRPGRGNGPGRPGVRLDGLPSGFRSLSLHRDQFDEATGRPALNPARRWRPTCRASIWPGA